MTWPAWSQRFYWTIADAAFWHRVAPSTLYRAIRRRRLRATRVRGRWLVRVSWLDAWATARVTQRRPQEGRRR